MMLSGDVSHTLPQPGFTKSRPILPPEESNNNILLNMDKVRHFLWIKDPIAWEEKQTRILFRGDVNGKPHRERFLEMWQHHPLCDLQAGGGLALYDHLKYRYIMSLEGNDVEQFRRRDAAPEIRDLVHGVASASQLSLYRDPSRLFGFDRAD